jgi:hypothetical protein
MSYTTQEAMAETRAMFEEAINSEDMEFVSKVAKILAGTIGWEEEAQILKDYYDRVVNDWVE